MTTSTLMQHAPFCENHDPDGLCRAYDLGPGDWYIGLSAETGDDGSALVRAYHPNLLPDETRVALTPDESVEIGLAYVIQGLRARGIDGTDMLSAIIDAYCEMVRQ